MARQTETAHVFRHKPTKFSLETEKLVIRCDDGAVYEFERATDGPSTYELLRRFQPDSNVVSMSKAMLPDAVKETATELLGGPENWTK